MFPLLILALLSLVGFIMSQSLRSPMDRMSLSFKVGHKPYTPPPGKPKGKGKDKFMHLMARAKYSGNGVIGLSGKIAGTVFLSNNVVRVWRKPNNVRDSFTQFVRGIFSGTSTAWKTLTSSQLAGWVTAATLAFSKKTFATEFALKGNAFFQRVNNTLNSLALAPTPDAPGIATPAFVITNATAAASEGGGTLGLTITEFNGAVVLPANTYLKVYATRQTNIGKSRFSASQYRFIGFGIPTDSTNPFAAGVDYIARFGNLVQGQRIGIAMEVISYDTAPLVFGASGKFYLDVIVGA